MSRKFIIPTKENKIAILCTTKEEFVELLSSISNSCLLYTYGNFAWDCCENNKPRYILWCKAEGSVNWRLPALVPDCYEKITFQEAILQNRSKLAKILEVEDNQNFKFRRDTYRVRHWSSDDFTELCFIDPAGRQSSTVKLPEIIAFSDEIEFPIKMASDEVLKFIKKFQWDIELFANGMCYWFAHILHNRFENSSIEYHPIDNHFSCRIMNVNYDITGVIDGSGYVDWNEYQKFDPVHAERIEKYCIRKED